jgi:CheY-like chemotaxis protein
MSDTLLAESGVWRKVGAWSAFCKAADVFPFYSKEAWVSNLADIVEGDIELFPLESTGLSGTPGAFTVIALGSATPCHLSTPADVSPSCSPTPAVFSMRRLKILLAEDDDDLRELYVHMLVSAGYKVTAVRSGLEALAEIQVNRPDAVVTDIGMQDFSGLDLIVAIRSNDELADLPIVAITSFGENLREQARAAGATDAIDKLTELTRMLEVIDAAVTRPVPAHNITEKTSE